MNTFRELIDAQARLQPEAPFLFAPEPALAVNYGELRETCERVATLLDDAGVQPGETVSCMLPNGVSAAALFLGTMYAGRVISPINLLAQDSQLAYTLAHSDTRLVFA